jgi:hypothetical protein
MHRSHTLNALIQSQLCDPRFLPQQVHVLIHVKLLRSMFLRTETSAPQLAKLASIPSGAWFCVALVALCGMRGFVVARVALCGTELNCVPVRKQCPLLCAETCRWQGF